MAPGTWQHGLRVQYQIFFLKKSLLGMSTKHFAFLPHNDLANDRKSLYLAFPIYILILLFIIFFSGGGGVVVKILMVYSFLLA